MSKPDFTRTSSQVERDILNLVDNIDRSLDSSNGESERKGHFLLSAFVSALAVFGSILGIQHFVAGTDARYETAAVAPDPNVELSKRDLMLVAQHLQRTRDQVRFIRDTKDRVAPSMLIDGNLNSIENSMADLGGLMGTNQSAEPRN